VPAPRDIVTLAAAAAAASDMGGPGADDGMFTVCPRVADVEADELLAVLGVPFARFMGVELALFVGAMLAGDGSMGGVGCEPGTDWPAECSDGLSTSAAAAAARALHSVTIFSMSGSRAFAI
jgi:hypothetical protein